MSESIWVNGTSDELDTTTDYLPLFGVRAVKDPIPISWYRSVVSIDCTLDRLRVSLDTAPGVGESRTFTVHGGASGGAGSDQALTVTISGTDTEGQDLVNTLGVSPGAWVSLKCAASASAAAARVRFSVRCDGDNAGETALCGVGDTGAAHNSLTRYFSLGGAQLWGGIPATNGGSVMLVSPCAGTVARLYVEISVAPGIDGLGNPASRDFTVYGQDGATVLTCTVSGAARTANDTVHSFAVAAGDYFYLECVPVSSGPPLSVPPATARLSASVAFTPDDGKSFIIPSMSDAMNPSGGTKYRQAGVGIGVWNGTETNVRCSAQAMKITRQQALLDGAPWLADDDRGYAFELIQNSGATILGCSIRGLSTSCFDVDDVTVADDDLLSLKMTPILTPGAPSQRHGAVSYLAEMLVEAAQGAAMMSLF